MKAKKLIACILTSSLLLSTGTGCGKKNTSSSLKTVKQNHSETAIFELAQGRSGAADKTSDEDLKKAYSEFVFGLISRCAKSSKGSNFMISPDSILFLMEMVGAGADGNTLDQIQGTLFPGVNKEDAFLYSVERMKQLMSPQLSICNSLWINQNMECSVYDNYLQYVKSKFDAGVDSLSFNKSGVDKINSWVKEKTDGMIDNFIGELSSDDLMVLINAMAFEADWEKKFQGASIDEDYFYLPNGKSKKVTFLSGENDVPYFHCEDACGFYKTYKDGKYAFLTILPDDKSIDINEYVSSLTAEKYWRFWESKDYPNVEYKFPQFTSEYDISLPDILKDMGIRDAFDPESANFKNMSDLSPLSVSAVKHKTYIEVTPKGTKAAAASAAIVEHNGAIVMLGETYHVICDRPFAYAIVDIETGLPIFFGTVENVNG